MTDEERGLLDYIADNFDTDMIERDGVFVRTRPARGRNSGVGCIAGSVSTKGYSRLKISNDNYLSHRLVYLWVNKHLPIGEIDHINHKKQDNRPCNIRDVTHRENSINAPLRRNTKSNDVGVRLARTLKNGLETWHGEVGGRQKHGHVRKSFRTKQEAIDFVTAKRAELGYHENHGKPKTTEATTCEV